MALLSTILTAQPSPQECVITHVLQAVKEQDPDNFVSCYNDFMRLAARLPQSSLNQYVNLSLSKISKLTALTDTQKVGLKQEFLDPAVTLIQQNKLAQAADKIFEFVNAV
jgi:hypothetical protein